MSSNRSPRSADYDDFDVASAASGAPTDECSPRSGGSGDSLFDEVDPDGSLMSTMLARQALMQQPAPPAPPQPEPLPQAPSPSPSSSFSTASPRPDAATGGGGGGGGGSDRKGVASEGVPVARRGATGSNPPQPRTAGTAAASLASSQQTLRTNEELGNAWETDPDDPDDLEDALVAAREATAQQSAAAARGQRRSSAFRRMPKRSRRRRTPAAPSGAGLGATTSKEEEEEGEGEGEGKGEGAQVGMKSTGDMVLKELYPSVEKPLFSPEYWTHWNTEAVASRQAADLAQASLQTRKQRAFEESRKGMKGVKLEMQWRLDHPFRQPNKYGKGTGPSAFLDSDTPKCYNPPKDYLSEFRAPLPKPPLPRGESHRPRHTRTHTHARTRTHARTYLGVFVWLIVP